MNPLDAREGPCGFHPALEGPIDADVHDVGMAVLRGLNAQYAEITQPNKRPRLSPRFAPGMRRGWSGQLERLGVKYLVDCVVILCRFVEPTGNCHLKENLIAH